MPTLKQLEALRWIVALGSFERAAGRLNATQSAISKRIHELESSLGVTLFDRSQRGARLTAKGEAILAMGEEMLALRDRLRDLADSRRSPIRRLRFGVTELTALTWLPGFVSELRQAYPRISLEPEVEQSVDLVERLGAGSVDFVIVPDAFWQPGWHSVPLASVENAWMCSPDILPEQRYVMRLSDLMLHPVLVQGDRSGSGLIFDQWLQRNAIRSERIIRSNSLIALVGLTVAAVGISYLPRQCFRGLVERGTLRIVESDPALPAVTYVMLFRADEAINVVDALAGMARRACDFTTPVRWQ